MHPEFSDQSVRVLLSTRTERIQLRQPLLHIRVVSNSYHTIKIPHAKIMTNKDVCHTLLAAICAFIDGFPPAPLEEEEEAAA